MLKQHPIQKAVERLLWLHAVETIDIDIVQPSSSFNWVDLSDFTLPHFNSPYLTSIAYLTSPLCTLSFFSLSCTQYSLITSLMMTLEHWIPTGGG